jgi:hypothetical protein
LQAAARGSREWFGIAEADLAGVAPHIGNFVERDPGFLT